MTASGAESRWSPAERAWREGGTITYREQCLDYGNDGHPENDLSLSPGERSRLDRAVTTVANATGENPRRIRAGMRDAAYAHGQDPGTDDDPDRFAPPEWVTRGREGG